MNNNEPISEQYLRKAHEWADLDAAATMLEESKSAVMSQRMTALNERHVNRAELKVRASQEWRDYIQQMVEARRKANHAKVELEYLRMKHREWIGEDANNRLQAKL